MNCVNCGGIITRCENVWLHYKSMREECPSSMSTTKAKPIAGAGEGGSERCVKPAGSMIPRLGWSYACVLDKGHTDPCMRGGNCNKHGAYIGNQCPKWPDCIQLPKSVASSPVEGGSPRDTHGLKVEWSDEDQLFVARVLEMDWVTGHGDTRESAIAMAEDNYKEALDLLASKPVVPLDPLGEPAQTPVKEVEAWPRFSKGELHDYHLEIRKHLLETIAALRAEIAAMHGAVEADYLIGRCIPLIQILAHEGNNQAKEVLGEIKKYTAELKCS